MPRNGNGVALRKIPSAPTAVERRTARKIISPDHEPMIDVFSKKRKAGHKYPLKENVVEEIDKHSQLLAKRPKRSSGEKVVPQINLEKMETDAPKKRSPQTITPIVLPKIMDASEKKKVDVVVKKPIVEKHQTSINDLPWVDKYKPDQIKQLVGQHTDKSPLNKLLAWLRDWSKNNLGAGALQKKPRPTAFQAQNDGTAFKAVLLSGPPGIGKTSCAVMVCKELGLRFIETNASDARNKKSIELHVAGLLDNAQINKYFSADQKSSSSKVKGIDHVLIMDEVDGMSGNQDRAGIAELILMIKRTKIPIICICNDRQSSKIRSLANYCFDLRFSRPRAEQIKGRLLTIVAQERLNVSKEVLDQIIEASNHDIRQSIYSLQLVASCPAVNSSNQFQKKDVSVNVFEAARRLLSNESNLAEKQEMFFSDYSIMPLFIQENYVNVRASKIGNNQHLRMIRQAADYIAFGDIINRQIRSLGAWNLLVDQSMFSCVLPSMTMDGHLSQQLQFPAWFGKYSNATKRQRLMRQLSNHTHLKISGSSCALVMDYLPVLRDRLFRPLVEKDTAGVKTVIELYKAYDLVKDDVEAINDLGIWPSGNKASKDISQYVSTKAKTALTRTLNKEHRLLPFSQAAPVKGRKRGGAVGGEILEIDEEGHEVIVGGVEDEDDELLDDE